MALSTQTAGQLVDGAPAGQAMAEMKVKVLRAFMYRGKAVDVGQTVTVPRPLGLDLLAINKAEEVAGSAPKAEKEPAAPAKKPAAKKGGASK